MSEISMHWARFIVNYFESRVHEWEQQNANRMWKHGTYETNLFQKSLNSTLSKLLSSFFCYNFREEKFASLPQSFFTLDINFQIFIRFMRKCIFK